MATTPLKNLFVINLCAATSPIGLTPPDHAGLKRFNFFVSRRREEGRERFRLHMGYFASQEEAEKLLDIVREIYPGAWAGLAPGQRLRAQARARFEAEAKLETAASAPPAAAMSEPPPMREAPVMREIPGMPAVAVMLAAPVAPAAAAAAPAELALLPDEGRATPSATSAAERDGAVLALSNVRAAIASLEDTDTSAPTVRPIPELKPATSAPSGAYRELSLAASGSYPARAATTSAPIAASPELSEAVVLDVLEGEREPASATPLQSAASSKPQVPAPKAPHKGQQQAASDAPPRDDKAAFAVQLLWSVQPIDMTQIPQLAIFSAYTLYGAEGNRDGRRWYGVRLGFFTDAVSAKQVAHYVRSDFSTVSVVPVTVRERERAKLASTRPNAAPVGTPAAAAAGAGAGAGAPTPTAALKPSFEFIDDKQPENEPRSAKTPLGRATSAAPGKRAKLRSPRQINGRAKAKPMTLEETLEILGAGQLRMDDGRPASINEAVAHNERSEPVKGKSSRIGRLLERLSERLGN